MAIVFAGEVFPQRLNDLSQATETVHRLEEEQGGQLAEAEQQLKSAQDELAQARWYVPHFNRDLHSLDDLL